MCLGGTGREHSEGQVTVTGDPASSTSKITLIRAVTEGTADAPWAGGGVNINRPKVKGACVIAGLAASSPADRPVCPLCLLHLCCLPVQAQGGGWWAGARGSSRCESGMSDVTQLHQQAFSRCHRVPECGASSVWITVTEPQGRYM